MTRTVEAGKLVSNSSTLLYSRLDDSIARYANLFLMVSWREDSFNSRSSLLRGPPRFCRTLEKHKPSLAVIAVFRGEKCGTIPREHVDIYNNQQITIKRKHDRVLKTVDCLVKEANNTFIRHWIDCNKRNPTRRRDLQQLVKQREHSTQPKTPVGKRAGKVVFSFGQRVSSTLVGGGES